MGELIYSFASLAARHSDGVTCLDGMWRLAETLHPHGVRITWIVSGESARIAAEPLTRWYREFGDEVAVCIPDLAGSPDDKKAKVAAERYRVQQALPWAEPVIAACNHQDPDLPAILSDLGFVGLWGFCWEQIEVDQITDRGMPWGFYYIDPRERLRPAEGRGLVAIEWTARDLLKSFHSGNPCLYSTDPNDVARGGIGSWEDRSYWLSIADNYSRNTRYNDHVFLVQHQEAHEMERNEFFQCYTEEDIAESLFLLESFIEYIKERAQFLTLSEAVALYRERYEHTPSSYMLWKDEPTPPYNPDYSWSTPVGPWPKTFLYYDRGAQLVFIDGKVEPICIRNYSRPWKPGEYFQEPDIPRTRLIRDTRFTWSREIEIAVQSPRAMPYGLALWGEYALYMIDEAPGLIEGKMLPHELLFLRYDLHEGENRFLVRLRGK